MRSRYALEQTPEQEEYERRMAEIKEKKNQKAARTSTKTTEITKSESSEILLEMQELEQKIPNEKSSKEKLKMQLRLKELGNRLPQIQSTENDFVDLEGASALKPDPFSKNRTGVTFPRQKQAYASKQRNNKFATDPQAGKSWAIENSQLRQHTYTTHNNNNINEFTLNNNNMYHEARSVSPKGMSVGKRKRRTKRQKKTKKKRRTKRR